MTYQPIKDWAFSYRVRGFSPIPIVRGSKVPGYNGAPMKNWTRFCENAASTAEITTWAYMDPQAGIGLACGYNGLVAIDVDNPIAYPAIREVFGDIKPPSKIGRRGVTAFFWDGGACLSSRKFLAKPNPETGAREMLVEVLSTGNQTVIYPTIHPDTGIPYKSHNASLEDLRPDQLPLVTQDKLDELAQALAPLMEPKREIERVKVDPAQLTETLHRRYAAYAPGYLARQASRLASKGRPGRNGDLFTITCFIVPLVRNGFLSQQEVEEAMFSACESNGLVKDNGPRDVLTTISKAFKHSKNGLPELEDRQRRAA